jgi:hypothetical protein
MAATTLETALRALTAALDAATAAEVLRNADRPERVGPAGLVVLGDGSQAEMEVSLSPLRYHVVHQAQVIVVAQDEATRDAILADIAAALVADRTLSGAVEWLDLGPVDLDLADFADAEALRAALLPVDMHYTTLGNPAG